MSIVFLSAIGVFCCSLTWFVSLHFEAVSKPSGTGVSMVAKMTAASISAAATAAFVASIDAISMTFVGMSWLIGAVGGWLAIAYLVRMKTERARQELRSRLLVVSSLAGFGVKGGLDPGDAVLKALRFGKDETSLALEASVADTTGSDLPNSLRELASDFDVAELAELASVLHVSKLGGHSGVALERLVETHKQRAIVSSQQGLVNERRAFSLSTGFLFTAFLVLLGAVSMQLIQGAAW